MNLISSSPSIPWGVNNIHPIDNLFYWAVPFNLLFIAIVVKMDEGPLPSRLAPTHDKKIVNWKVTAIRPDCNLNPPRVSFVTNLKGDRLQIRLISI